MRRFLRNEGFRLREAGELAASPSADGGDPCRAGCYYDFARPVFLRGRIFALIGGELVEGTMDGGRVREVRRVRFAPPATAQVAR